LKSDLAKFEGAIALDLTYEGTGTNNYPWFNVVAIADSWNNVSVGGNTSPSKDGGSLTIRIEADDVAYIMASGEGNLNLQVNGIYFTEAVVRDATDDDFYKGNNNEAMTLSKSELQSYNSAVTVFFDIRTIADKFGYYQIFLQEKGGSWQYLGADRLVGDYNLNSYNCIDLTEGDEEIAITISAEAIANLQGDLKVGVYGIIIEDYEMARPN